MRRIILSSIVCLALMTSGCSSEKEKINIIEGAGAANNSLMSSLYELCPGTSEGFLDKDNLLVNQKDTNGDSFFSVALATKEKSLLSSMLLDKNYYVEISPDGKQFIADSYLITIDTKQKMFLAGERPNAPTPSNLAYPSSFSFTEESEAVYTNPFYYINKYYFGGLKSLDNKADLSVKPVSFVRLGEMAPNLDKGAYKNLKIPKIDYLTRPKVLINELKYIFIGYKKDTSETPLYLFDLFSRKFQLIDENVKYYAISPDRETIAYVKKTSGDTPSEKIYVASIKTGTTKELAELPSIAGLSWSFDNSWVTYSGGEKSKNDIWIIRADGTGQEQLTHGIDSTNKLSWSQSGNKIAFTTATGSSLENPKVYIITLNTPEITLTNNAAKPDPSKQAMAHQLLDVLRAETAINIKSSIK